MDRQRNSADGTPLYARVGRILRQRITDGYWEVGQQIPTIELLMSEFGVARATVREALQQLITEGLLESQRGRGTTVISAPSSGRSINSPIASDSDVHIEILSIDRDAIVPGSVAGNCKLESSYLKISKVHLRNGIPVTAADIFVAGSLAKNISDEEIGSTMMVTLLWSLLAKTGHSFEHRLTIASADLEIADRLECLLADPIVRIDRKCVKRRTNLLLYSAAAAYPGRSYELRFAGDIMNFAWLDASIEPVK